MKVYTTDDGRVIAEAQTVKDVRKLLALDMSNIEKARAVLYAGVKPDGRRGARYTKTHTCGMKYKYLAHHLKHCPEAIPVTRVL